MTKTLDAVAPSSAPTNGRAKRRLITKDAIKAAKPAAYQDIPCDEWEEGTAFRVGPMDFDTHDKWEIAQVALGADPSGESLRGLRLIVVGRAMIDEGGARVFKSDEEVTSALATRDARPILRAFDAVLKLSRTIDAQVEDAAKNSDSAPSEGRSTA